MDPVRRSCRQFLKAAAAFAALPTLIPASALGVGGRPAPSNRIAMAVIGLGGRGNDHLGGFMGFPQVQMLAAGRDQAARDRTQAGAA